MAPIRVAVLTISDTTFLKMRRDESGPAVQGKAVEQGWEVTVAEVLPDEREMISKRLRELADGGLADAVLTTGGTGAAARDVTPEATRDVIEREMPGLPERMRADCARHTKLAALSRGVAGLRGKTLIVNLPGSPRGAVESLDAILDLIPHIVGLLRGQTGH